MSQAWKTTAVLAGVLALASATAWAAGGVQPQPLPQPSPGGPSPRRPAPVSVSIRVTPPTVKIDNPVTIHVGLTGGPPLVAGGAVLHPVYSLTAIRRLTTAPAGRSAPPAGGGERTVVATRARTEPLTWRPVTAGTYDLQLVVEWADPSGRVAPGTTTVAWHRGYEATK